MMDQVSPAVRALWRLLYILESEELDWRTNGRRREGKQRPEVLPLHRINMENNSNGQRFNSINNPDSSRAFHKMSILYEDDHNQKRLNLSPKTSLFLNTETVPALSSNHVELHRITKNITKNITSAPTPSPEKIVDCPKVVSTNDLSTHDHKGWLIDHLKGTKVWCAVSNKFLCVFEKENSSASKHVILLPGCLLRFLKIPPVDLKTPGTTSVSRHFKVDNSISGTKFQFFLEDSVTKQKYFFGASSRKELLEWRKALDSARSTSPNAHNIKNDVDQENYATKGDDAQNNILLISKQASENTDDQSKSKEQKSKQSEVNHSPLTSKRTTPLFKIIKSTVPDDNAHERFKVVLPTESPKLAPMRASHDVLNISYTEEPDGKSRGRSRGLFRLKSPLDILFKRQERSHSADDVVNRKHLRQQKNKEQGTQLAFTPPLDRKISTSLNSSQCSISSLGDGNLTFLDNTEIPPAEQSQSTQRNKKSSLRHSRSFSQLTSGLKNSMLRHFSSKRSFPPNKSVKVRDLKDVRISGILQYWSDNHTRQRQVFCAVSRGSFYMCKSDHRDETPEVVIRLAQCQVAYAPRIGDRLESLFAFTVKPAHGEEFCFSVQDQQTVLTWMLVLQNEAAKVQNGNDLPCRKQEEKQPFPSSEISNSSTLLPDDTGNSFETRHSRSQIVLQVNRLFSRLKNSDDCKDYTTPRDVLLRRTKSDLDVVNTTEVFDVRTSSFQSTPQKLLLSDGKDFRQFQASTKLPFNQPLYKMNHQSSLTFKPIPDENTELKTSKMPEGLMEVSAGHESGGDLKQSSAYNLPAADTDQSSRRDAVIGFEKALEPMTSPVMMTPRPLTSSVSSLGLSASPEMNSKSVTLTEENSTCEILSKQISRSLNLSAPNLTSSEPNLRFTTSLNSNSRSATSSEVNSMSSNSTTQMSGVKEYFFGSSVHDECLKAAWAMDEEFLLQAVKDKLRQRSMRKTKETETDCRGDGSIHDVCVVADNWNVAETTQTFTTVDAALEFGRGQTLPRDPDWPSVSGEIPVPGGEFKDQEGFLERLEKDETWQRYWCVLRKDYLQYYREQKDSWPSEVILLSNCSIFGGLTSIQGRQCILQLTQKGKDDIITLRADSQVQYREWLESLVSRLTSTSLPRDSQDGPISLDEPEGVKQQATAVMHHKLMSEVLKQRYQSRSPQTTRTGNKSEINTDPYENPDSSMLSLVSEEEKTCLITRLTRQRISTLIKLNAVQKQLEASSQYTQERKAAALQAKGKSDLLEVSASPDRSADLKEQVGMLSSQLQELDRVLVSHGSTPQKSAPKVKVRGLLRHSFDHDLLQNLKLTAEANRRKQSDQSSLSDVKVKVQDVFRPVSIKTTVQKLALKTFDMASFYWRKRPSEQPDLEIKSGWNAPDSVNATKDLDFDSDVTDLTKNPQCSENPSSLDQSDVTDSPHLSRNGAALLISRSLPGSLKREGNQTLSKKIGSGLSPPNTETHLSAKVGDPNSGSPSIVE